LKIDTNEIIFFILLSCELEVDGIEHLIKKLKEVFTGNAYG